GVRALHANVPLSREHSAFPGQELAINTIGRNICRGGDRQVTVQVEATGLHHRQLLTLRLQASTSFYQIAADAEGFAGQLLCIRVMLSGELKHGEVVQGPSVLRVLVADL